MLVLAQGRPYKFLFILIALVGASACNAGPQHAENEGEAQMTEAAGVPFVGKVVWQDLEGGFWGIETVEGKHLLPMGLADEFKVDGLSVRGKFRALKDVMTIQMWGTPVEITHIEPRK